MARSDEVGKSRRKENQVAQNVESAPQVHAGERDLIERVVVSGLPDEHSAALFDGAVGAANLSWGSARNREKRMCFHECESPVVVTRSSVSRPPRREPPPPVVDAGASNDAHAQTIGEAMLGHVRRGS